MSSGGESSHGGEYKTLRQITRERLLQDMLRSTKVGDSKSIWKVLIMDKFTVKVMSCCCKMADMIEEGVSLVEDLYKRRQPLPTMDSIYFIQPSRENVVMFLSDMSGRCPLYRKAYVFFSSPIPKDLVAMIKQDTSVLPRIGALKEMNLEYLTIDNQGFITDHERAMEQLFGENVESSSKYNDCINTMATRIATVFASLRELPYVRYRAAKSSLDVSTMTTLRDLVPTKLAAAVWNILLKYKQSVLNFPQAETCELLIVDRSIDQIAPIIHEWTYDAMCHDLLNIEGNKYIHEITKPDGVTEKKEYLLEDHDAVWLELRHSHIAEVFEKLDDKMRNFVSKNKAAQMHSSRGGGELSTKDMQKVVQALPQYTEQYEKLSLHVGMAEKIKKIIGETGLKDVGKLEQELVFGDAAAKEMINFLRTNQDANPEYKLRLLMIYASCLPDKFEGDKGLKLMQLARISPDDMNAVTNMRFLGTADTKKESSGGFSLKFDMQKKKHAARKDKSNGQEQWQLSRFYPLIEELIEDLSKGELSKSEYACMNSPSETVHGTGAQGVSVRSSTGQPAHSMRSKRTATWATRSHGSDDGYSSDSVLRHNSGDFKKMGQRIFIFVIGGATRSELRVCHKLTANLRREVILGSTSIDDPPQFITKLKMLTAGELSIDDLHI